MENVDDCKTQDDTFNGTTAEIVDFDEEGAH